MNRILVPYDFSEVADHALDFAVQVASKSEAKEVMILNVIEHPSESRLKYMGATDMDPMEQVYFNKLIKLTKDKLTKRIADGAFAVNVTSRIQLGSPYYKLSEEIKEEEVDLVVMGTSGADGVDEVFVGSNAERVVRTSTCPVVTLKGKANVDDLKSIVFASNFQEVTDSFATQIKALQSMLGAKLKIVKINTPANFTTQRHDMDQMLAFVEKFGFEDATVDVYNYTNEEDGIIYYADDIKADMIAIGTNQRTGFNHFLMGSIAEDVVNHAKRPVWTLRLDI
jgi:nucleotide-binding universal stress UspA family protein